MQFCGMSRSCETLINKPSQTCDKYLVNIWTNIFSVLKFCGTLKQIWYCVLNGEFSGFFFQKYNLILTIDEDLHCLM